MNLVSSYIYDAVEDYQALVKSSSDFVPQIGNFTYVRAEARTTSCTATEKTLFERLGTQHQIFLDKF